MTALPRRQWTIWRIVKTIWVSSGLLFTFWLFYSYQSQGVDSALLLSNEEILVDEKSDFYAFEPTKDFKEVLIFYPGAMVDSEAYVPLCRKIATQQIKVYLIKMPWRLATKGYNLPKELNLFGKGDKTYILAGHSQGAKMAVQFVYENPKLIDQLILIGTTHPRDISLYGSNIPILKIYDSNDGVADENTIMYNRSRLPSTTKFVKIEGANHAQFGYYGFQLGDNEATISREQQQEETYRHIMAFVRQ
jgi:hypothetical protein